MATRIEQRTVSGFHAAPLPRVRDGKLVLGFDLQGLEWLTFWFKWFTLPNKTVRYTLTAPVIDEIELLGSSTISADAMVGPASALKIAGSGTVRLRGVEAGRLYLSITGSGDIELAGRAESQEISISGSGKVRYTGDPGVAQRVTGSGSVAKAG